MQQLLQVTQNTAMNVNSLSEQMGVATSKFTAFDKRLSTLEHDFTELKNNEILDSAQRRRIPKSVKARVSYLLGISWVKGKVAKECIGNYSKYYRGFMARIYSDAKNLSKMADDYRDTKKIDYDEVMTFITNWSPSGGVDEHKKYLDDLHASNARNSFLKAV